MYGFLGVDVFFVISGYLIIGKIVRDLDNGVFRLKDFYLKRIRRIIPPIVFVVSLCIPIAWLTLLPSELKDFFQSVFASLTFTSNFLFMREAGYFEPASQLKPLVHTWSLAIEEQFYLVIPVLLLALTRKFATRRLEIFSFLILTSFSLWLFAVLFDFENYYYGFQYRFWELGLGGLIATGTNEIKFQRYLRKFRPFAWLGLIVIPVDFPIMNVELKTPLICLLTGVLLGTRSHGTSKNYFAKTLIAHVGGLSYALYLVHQPILAFLRLRSIDIGFLMTFSLVYLLALITYFSIERPIWKLNLINNRNLLVGLSVISIFLMTFSFLGHQTGGFPNRVDKSIQDSVFPAKTHTEICEDKPKFEVGRAKICLFGATDSSKGVLVYGDSHAWHLMGELDRSFKSLGIKGFRAMVREECSIFPQISQVSQNPTPELIEGCKQDFRAILKFVAERNLQSIIASRWSIQMHPIPGLLIQRGFDNGVGGIETERNEVQVYVGEKGDYFLGLSEKREAILYVLESLERVSRGLIVVYPVPEVGWQLARKNFISDGNYPVFTSYPAEAFYNRNELINRILDDFSSSHSSVSKIRPSEIFCNTWAPKRCVVQIRATPLYYDYNHLSDYGARFVVDQIVQNLK
jgi:peptidoglycan/LPS O-acetylase OafA/YrhL